MNKRLALFLLGVFFSNPLWAQEISYDRYGPIWREGPLKKKPSAELLQAWGKHFLVYPFEVIRWPIDETLLFVEEHHIDDKVDWIYDQLKSHGFTPKVRSLFGVDGFGGGFDIEFVRLTGLKDRFPDSTVEGTALWTMDNITEYEARISQKRIFGSLLGVEAGLKYQNRGEEHFYGIGPNTSLGDGTSYRMERTTVETILDWPFLEAWDFRGKFAFQNVNITNGEDGGRGIIDEIFVRARNQSISGLGGDEILSWGLEIEHDNRDSPELPTEGGVERFSFSYHKGLDSRAGFFKYRAEASHFFKIFSERRIFGVRALLEHNDETKDRDVPFFDMARLGGYGTSPRIGDTHRGFRRDRFYDESLLLLNAEYRWAVWEYRDWRMDSVLFCDVGQVFGEWSHFQFEDFRISYGLGFRVSFEKEIVLNLEIGKSGEGTQFYVKTKAPF